MTNLNSFQTWAIKAAHDRNIRCRPFANWVEIYTTGNWREYMSVSGVCDAIGAFEGTPIDGLYR